MLAEEGGGAASLPFGSGVLGYGELSILRLILGWILHSQRLGTRCGLDLEEGEDCSVAQRIIPNAER